MDALSTLSLTAPLTIGLLLTAFAGGAFASFARQRHAREEMRISKEFFQSTFDSAAVGMAVADLSGRYIKVNRAMCNFVGYTEAELLQMSYHQITHPDDLAENVSARIRLVNGELPTFQQEKRYVRKDGRVVWALMVVSQVVDQHGKVAYSVGQMLDIDTQKQIERDLRASRASLAHAQHIARIGDWEWDTGSGVLRWSEEITHLFGAPPAKAPQTHDALIACFHPDERSAIRQAFNTALASGEPFSMDGRMQCADGSERFVYLQGEPIAGTGTTPPRMCGTLQDITERKRTELALIESRRQLRELSSHQKSLLEDERKHIAREIHDELGQRLTALKMEISLLRLGFGNNPELFRIAEEMRTLADGTMDVVRQIASNLRPAALDLGLVPAIEWLAEDLQLRSEIRCELEIGNEEIPMGDLPATVAFRVVQESLTNVARHAAASAVHITLHEADGQLHVCIRDNGKGFDTSAGAPREGFGLLGMRERVLALNGTLRVDSAPGQGTTVSIDIPLPGAVRP